MARDGSGSVSNIYRSHVNNGSPITSFPFTISFWYRTPSVIGDGGVISWGDSTLAPNSGFYIEDYLGSFYVTSYLNGSNDTSNFGAESIWDNMNIHMIYSCASSTSRFFSANGTIKNFTASKTVQATADRWGIGGLVSNLTPSNAMATGHYVSEIAIWNTALDSGDDITSLYTNAMSPLLVKPGNLVTYCPLNESGDTCIDWVGGRHLEKVGSGMTFTEQDVITQRRRRSFSIFGPPGEAAASSYNSIFHGSVF